MPKFRKKNVVIEAVHFDGSHDSALEVVAWAKSPDVKVSSIPSKPPLRSMDWIVSIKTLEGTMTASADDWVIRGVKDELYPCKPDIFRDTYDAVVEGEHQIETKRGVLAIQVGDEDWEPTSKELREITDLFLTADQDPQGAVLAVRKGIELKRLGGEVIPNVAVMVVGSEDWTPTDAQLKEVVDKLSRHVRDRFHIVLRDAVRAQLDEQQARVSLLQDVNIFVDGVYRRLSAEFSLPIPQQGGPASAGSKETSTEKKSA